MSRQLQLTAWQQQLATHFPPLSAPVVAVLALYSFGMILARVAGLTTVVLFLSRHLVLAPAALRKRLREFYLDANEKSGVPQGGKRRAFEVATTFAPLLRWIVSLWSGTYLPLAIDVTNLGERFHVLCVSVVVRGTALPVAWKVLHGGLKEPWNPHWKALLTLLRTAVPDDWRVIVLSDRGLESSTLFRDIVALGWHPIMRVKKGGKFRPKGWGTFYGMQELASQRGASCALEGRAYAGEQLPCTLLTRWEEGYPEPWLVLTDLPPETGVAIWYGLRTWIEQGFKVIKGGGWDWEKTRMTDPSRVERLWLVLAVATLWVTSLGIAQEVREEQAAERRVLEEQLQQTSEQAQAREALEAHRRARQEAAQEARRVREAKRQEAKATKSLAKKSKSGALIRRPESGATSKYRVHRLSKLGLVLWETAWERGETLLPQNLHPEPWPIADHEVTTLNEQDFLSRQT